MNAKQVLQTSFLAVAVALTATAANAQTQAPTRADMKAAVLEARARGELVPAGQAIQPFAPSAMRSAQRSRMDVREEVLQARASGELVPAGQGMDFDVATTSIYARADVKDEVRVARQRGELIPAGQGIGPVEYQARGQRMPGATYAANRRR